MAKSQWTTPPSSAEFECGALGSFEATRFASGHKNGMSFEVNGSKGSLKFEFERMNELWYYSSDDPEGLRGFRLIQATEPVHPYAGAWWPAGHVIGYEHTFVHELFEFIQSIATGRRLRTSKMESMLRCSRQSSAPSKRAHGIRASDL